MTRFAADVSTLILLAKAEILPAVTEDHTFWITEVVKGECLARPTIDAQMISAALDAGRIELHPVGASGAIRTLRRDFALHRGEAESLELALRRDLPLAVDDYAAIKACRVLKIPFAAAIHFLIGLKKKGRLDMKTAEARIEKLAFYGRYSSRIIQDALGRIRGEDE